jgi:hypothetical protein
MSVTSIPKASPLPESESRDTSRQDWKEERKEAHTKLSMRKCVALRFNCLGNNSLKVRTGIYVTHKLPEYKLPEYKVTIYLPCKVILGHLRPFDTVSDASCSGVCTAYPSNTVNASPVDRKTTRSEQEDSESSVPSIYLRLLQQYGYGYPIWSPEGDESLSKAYCDRGISIGDVGYISEGGNFRFLFNILKHAKQSVELGPDTDLAPEGFQPLELAADDIQIVKAFHPPDTCMCAPTMEVQIMSTKWNDGATS